MKYRWYQQNLDDGIIGSWSAGNRNVLAVMPCRSGKTVVIATLIKRNVGISFALVHRRELISQISVTLAKMGVYHRIVAPNDVIRWIIQLHIRATGKNFYNPNSKCVAAAVQTLLRRTTEYKALMDKCTLWVTDECHHIIKDNQWGKLVELLPNAFGVGFTATPTRADGRGLGRHADGVFDDMVIGPNARTLIKEGHICDYRIFAPPSDLLLENVPIGASGDYSHKPLVKEIKKSHLVGDVVSNYLRIAPGTQNVTFTTDIETAMEIKTNFQLNSIRAELVTGTTPSKQRAELYNRFERKEIQAIVNVDIMGEGIDIPGIESISLARPTQSYGLFVQQFFRPLTPNVSEGKTHGIIIDHVGNVMRHGLPDAPRNWTLDRRDKKAKKKDDVIPCRVCLNPECMSIYEALYKVCPYCGTVHIPAGRSKPEYVDGDLTELDVETLRAMRGEIDKIDEIKESSGGVIGNSIAKKHKERQEAQAMLRESIKWWAGHQQNLNREESEIYRRFYFKFDIDVMTAQTVGKPDAEKLAILINKDIDQLINKD